MKVKVKNQTAEITKSFSEDNEIAFDVYVVHKDKVIAEDVMDLLLDNMSYDCSSLDVDYIDDKWNVSVPFFVADIDDSDDLISLKKSNWEDDFKSAIKKLRKL